MNNNMSDNNGKHKKTKAPREFDFERYHERHVAFLLTYLGHEYSGIAYQPDNPNTVEHVLFEALQKIKLCRFEGGCPVGFSRCGRTDRGVSAFGNVIAMHVRSNLTRERDGVEFVRIGKGSAEAPDEAEERAEMDYVHLINRVLPPTVRLRAWSPVPREFSARFSCDARTYRYYFPITDGLDLARMRQASSDLLGDHDFRNFCKMDGSISNFVRTIHNFEISAVGGMGCATIRGNAFLYHQVRCMMAVLFMVGHRDEDPSIIRRLLDIAAVHSKPPYELADDHNLCLWQCDFPPTAGLQWRYSDTTSLAATLRGLVQPAMVKATLLQSMYDDVLAQGGETHPPTSRRKLHIPLLERPPEMDLEGVMGRKARRADAKQKRTAVCTD